MTANKFVDVAYFPGDTGIETPPEHFIQRLLDFDRLLVMFPSLVRKGCYVLARRREKSPGLTEGALGLFVNPDTKTCVAMGWVPVCMISKTGPGWNADAIVAKLQARDIREHGGADKVADMLEEQEAAEEAALKASIRQDLWDRSGEGWRSYQARTGQSTIRYNDTRESKAPAISEAADSTASLP